ncbi:hypothetical protein OEZ86_011523 [Tetradesmus obliquus]|nr:hypothetical protein OEZ86_011523 [Tetradesmus obliquus]
MSASQSASVSGLSLEAYLQLHKALTKNSSTVQSQSVIEECYYKVQDLKQLLALHGMSSSKFNRSEVLQALKGKCIVNPTSIIKPHSTQEEPQPLAAAAAAEPGSAGSSILLPFSQADLGSLGWAVDPGCALEQLHLGMPAGFQAAAAIVSQPATGQAPPTATAVADNVPSSAPMHQLRLFVAGGAVASREKLPPSPAAGAAAAAAGSLSVVPGAAGGPLLGRGIGFVLLEDMQVAGAKGATLTLPAGVYEGRAIKYLGSSCHPDVCDDGCSSDHQFYRARVMPPQLPQQGQPSLPGQAEAISQAHAAASGRPVLLILDLHTRLRCSGFAQMLQMAAEQLQDAWVLLAGSGQEQQQQQHGCSSAAAAQQPNAAAAAAAAGGWRKKGRPAASGQPGACKRSKA